MPATSRPAAYMMVQQLQPLPDSSACRRCWSSAESCIERQRARRTKQAPVPAIVRRQSPAGLLSHTLFRSRASWPAGIAQAACLPAGSDRQAIAAPAAYARRTWARSKVSMARSRAATRSSSVPCAAAGECSRV